MAKQKRITKTQALRLARDHPKLGRVLERGGKVVLVEPERGRGEGDRAVIGIQDRETGRSLVALVDPLGVVGVHETPAHFQLSPQERATAEKLAAADDRAKTFLRRRRMNPLTRLYFRPGDTSGHRAAIVFLRPTSSERRYVVVDLTDERVVEVLNEDDLTRESGA
jgi:hypothetical protein